MRLHVRRSVSWLEERIVWLGAAVLVFAYLITYADLPATPGNQVLQPQGWWGWFDQGNYDKSARALADLRFERDQHWYPLGYAILGAPFARFSIGHPYLVADLSCLLAAYAGSLVFAPAIGVGRSAAVAAFLFGTIGSASLRHAWTVPWNTTLSAALIWWLLALAAALVTRPPVPGPGRAPIGRRVRVFGIGALCAALVATRPTDLVVAGTVVVVGAASMRRRRVSDVAWLATGVALVAVPYGWLYLRIYGPHPTPYMLLSRGIGFSVTDLWWKTYLLLVTPRPWLPEGAGMLARLPWIAPGLACLISLPFLADGTRGRGPLFLLGGSIATTWTLFLAYADLQPSGLWTFGNVHYFKWTFPGLLLLGVVFCRGLASRGPDRRTLACVSAALLLASCVRLLPSPAPPGRPVWMLQVREPTPGFLATYFGSITAAGPGLTYVNTRDFRALPDDQGVRLIALSRPMRDVDSVRLQDGAVRRGPAGQAGWTIRTGFGWPCWLPPYPCDRAKPGP